MKKAIKQNEEKETEHKDSKSTDDALYDF